jgi:hypothetical protein
MDNMSLDKNRKRQFFLFMNLLIFPVIIFLGLMNYFRGAFHDLFLDILLCLVLTATVFSIQRFNADKIVYRFSLFVWFSIALYVAAAGSGYGSALYWILIAPVMLFFFFEKKEGLIWVGCIAVLAGILVLFPSLLGTYSYGAYHRIGFTASFLLITGIGYGIEMNRSRYSHLLAEERDFLALETRRLHGALAEIRTLNGMLPICARCKKIRDDKGYWQQVESYIQDRSDATFSHSICPECSAEYLNENDEI